MQFYTKLKISVFLCSFAISNFTAVALQLEEKIKRLNLREEEADARCNLFRQALNVAVNHAINRVTEPTLPNTRHSRSRLPRKK